MPSLAGNNMEAAGRQATPSVAASKSCGGAQNFPSCTPAANDSQGDLLTAVVHNEELVDARTQAAIRKAFVDAGITPMKPGVWKKHVQPFFMSQGSPAACQILHASCKTQGP